MDRGVDNNDDPDIVDGKMYEVTAPPSAAPTPTFGDVPLDHVFWREIESIYRAGITTSCSQNPMMFFPNALITRGQMAVLLLRGKHISNYTPPRATGAFSDVPTNYWAADWIEQLALEDHVGLQPGPQTILSRHAGHPGSDGDLPATCETWVELCAPESNGRLRGCAP